MTPQFKFFVIVLAAIVFAFLISGCAQITVQPDPQFKENRCILQCEYKLA